MSLSASDLLTLTREGLYCPLGGFHVDPTWPVPRALITHGHADHARSGHGKVLATGQTLRIMAVRYGEDFCEARQEAVLGEDIRIGDVTVRFAPAGHVLGSAQISIQAQGVRVVVSGDYKRAYDPTCLPFEVVPCDVFITEATFGLPVFRMPDTAGEVRKLLDSVALFPERAHIVGAYALGKAQRVMALLREAGYDEPIYLHGAMEKLTELYKREGVPARGDAEGRRDGARKTPRRHRALPALGDPGRVVAQISRSGHLLRLGLDAGAGAGPAEGRRTPPRHLRPFRLAGPVPHHPRDGGRGGLGHPRAGGRPGALVRNARDQGQAAAHAGLWR